LYQQNRFKEYQTDKKRPLFMKKEIALLITLCLCVLSMAASAQVVNGSFDGDFGWRSHVPGSGSVGFSGGQLRVHGSDEVSGPVTVYASQNIMLSAPGTLVFQLVSYESNDSGDYDFPVLVLNGQVRKLYSNGAVEGYDTPGRLIANNCMTHNTITFIIKLERGTHNIGFGVHSLDGYYGSGTAVFDNVAFVPDQVSASITTK
jgi:hypothetical protein